jgi:hypothetical protein
MRIQVKFALIALLLLAISSLPVSGFAQVKLTKGTEVTVALEQDVSSKYAKPGDEVPIKLLEDIDIGGLVLVSAGAPGTARVKSVEPAGKPGSGGSITVELIQLDPASYESMDGKAIKLEAKDGPITAEGKNKKLLSWLFIFGLFIKGSDAVIPADQPITAVVTEDVFIQPPEG